MYKTFVESTLLLMNIKWINCGAMETFWPNKWEITIA